MSNQQNDNFNESQEENEIENPALFDENWKEINKDNIFDAIGRPDSKPPQYPEAFDTSRQEQDFFNDMEIEKAKDLLLNRGYKVEFIG